MRLYLRRQRCPICSARSIVFLRNSNRNINGKAHRKFSNSIFLQPPDILNTFMHWLNHSRRIYFQNVTLLIASIRWTFCLALTTFLTGLQALLAARTIQIEYLLYSKHGKPNQWLPLNRSDNQSSFNELTAVNHEIRVCMRTDIGPAVAVYQRHRRRLIFRTD